MNAPLILLVSRHRLARLILTAALLQLCLGCGDGRETRMPVSGVVTIDGEPLQHGSITFLPIKEPGSVRRAGGASLVDGQFSVSSFTPNDGLMQGKYEVIVSATEPMGEVAQRWHAPKKYASVKTSGLVIEVSKAMEEVKFELSWKGDKHSKPFVEKF